MKERKPKTRLLFLSSRGGESDGDNLFPAPLFARRLGIVGVVQLFNVLLDGFFSAFM
jgi:hypothetical protein